MNNLIKDLTWRGILNNITNEEKLTYALDHHKGVYIGFDPSAKSLHLGNYAAIMLLRRFKNHGLKTFAIIGGATGMIGDPSGKSKERVLLETNVINENKLAIKAQLLKYAKVSEIVDNLDHYKDMSFLDFLRNVGKHINVNYLLEKEIIKDRLNTGISYTEFTYNLIQGYDFVTLYKEKDVYVQAGGSDQWGNITTGCEMIRKMIGEDNHACGLTLNLLLKADGTKFGKSENGAIFLDPNLTSVYEMYQFLINQEDARVIQLLRFLTELEQTEIEKLEQETKSNSRAKLAQQTLAKIIINDIHGEAAYMQAQKISQALFNDDIASLTHEEIKQVYQTIPHVVLPFKNYTLVELLTSASIATSNRDARELIENNSIMINGQKINQVDFAIDNNHILHKQFTIIKKGKRNYFAINWDKDHN